MTVVLSVRERQVLELIAEGRTTAAIARNLRLSPSTIGNHRGSLFRRLGARNEAHAVALGFRRGLLGVNGGPA